MTHSITLLLTILCAIACLPQIDGFTAGQPAPWIPPLNDNPNLKLNDVYILRRPSKKHSSAVSTADADSLDVAEDLADEDGIGDGPTSQVQDVSSRVNVQDIPRTVASISTRPPSTPEAATILSSIGPLLKMTRPGNLVGVVCFYLLGIYRSLCSLNLATTGNLIRTVFKPSMVATLFSLVLICSTSMMVNDYYDGKSGLDSYKLSNPLSDASRATQSHHINPNPNQAYKPLASGEVTYPITKRFLSYLYASLLISATLLPGVTARLSVILASMLTYWYTQHLKPKTWLKNVTCAALIALAPFTSASAALHLLANGSLSGAQGLGMAWRLMGRLTLALFSGVMGREIMMDIVDCEADKAANVVTVPVRYGRRFASRVGLGCMVGTSVLTTVGPLVQLLTLETSVGVLLRSGGGGLAMVAAALRLPALRRLILALTSSFWLIARAYQVQRTEGRDEIIMDRTIEDSKVCVLLILASFI